MYASASMVLNKNKNIYILHIVFRKNYNNCKAFGRGLIHSKYIHTYMQALSFAQIAKEKIMNRYIAYYFKKLQFGVICYTKVCNIQKCVFIFF